MSEAMNLERVTEPFRLRILPPSLMTPAEDLAMLRQAHSQDAASPGLRYAFAAELIHQDQFEEAIELLNAWQMDQPRFQLLLLSALESRQTPESRRELRDLCLAALAANTNPARRTEFLAMLGKAQISLGEFDAARETLREALELDPHNKDAYKRAASLELREGNSANVLAQAEQLYDARVLHSRVVASQALAMAQLGWMEEARRIAGLDTFLAEFEPARPEGWATLADFCSAVADEMRSHPGQRYNRYGTASAKTWRVDRPELQRLPIVPQLQRTIQREVERYVAELAAHGEDHPFLRGRPQEAVLRNWCVITEGDGYETWHVHQNGWLSGVFYPYVQDHIANGTGPEGCLAFGLPEEIIGADRAREFGERLVRPRTGLMLLFPSHTYHRTYAHSGPGRRICYAFDVIPLNKVVD